MTSGPIMIISGTNRPHSNALRVARVLKAHYDALKVQAHLYDLCDLPRDLFSPHVYAEKPAAFKVVQEQVLAAVGLHVVTPEYNGSYPGVLKYFIDMLKFPESFNRKPVAFVGESNGMFGALRSVEQLQMVFGYRNAFTFPERVFIARVKEKFDAEGQIRDADLDGRLQLQARAFAMFIACISNIP
jgi:NAD(P)H-dependent FMN reductase